MGQTARLLLQHRAAVSLSSVAGLISEGIAHQLFGSSSKRNPGHLTNFIVSNNYGKLGHHLEAHNSIIAELANSGQYREALRSFGCMNGLGQKPTKFTLCIVLNSCAKLLDWHLGLQVHAQLIRLGHEENHYLNSALVDLYAKCEAMLDAKKVFDSVKEKDEVLWTSVISGYSQNGNGKEACMLFNEMLVTNIRPNCFTFASVISACTGLPTASELVKILHAYVIKLGIGHNSFVASSLIDCYSKCGKIGQAVSLFNSTKERDSILFSSMIAGYSQNLLGEEALKLFVKMRGSGLDVTYHTFSSILNACGSLTIIQQGRQIHALITKMGSEGNVFIASSLIDMYSKCGSIDEARCIFDQTVKRNNILWTSMITGYAQSGRGAEGLELFELLVNGEGARPDLICFTAVLTACNHAGLLDRAIYYFNKMKDYGLSPELDQYACLIDLYGRNGHLRKVKKLMEDMPFEPNAVMWSSFLGSCRVFGEVELGKEAANQLFMMDPYTAAPYVTLSNIYAEAGMSGEVAEIRKMMKERGVRKNPGWSWVEVDGRVHVFSVGDTSHPRSQEIYVELDKLTLEMREAGYMPILRYLRMLDGQSI
ncbi:PREDICTED: pentatricopeptide repeat-containing protein At3g26782, mitochondrial-like [Nelumbo nucifera]|uniref:Pentatricopeptide repeat-containing protein At3g26782, mitochondrial-like n=2 Tax=Nelumbo nucifera TaxID=4432 RepID=A0A1U8B5S9_NELNU|nr:PREDICTED: pentatricopeptide repeat-containing protein At3g26782, mitochondrial-like [Nelumbo nucifera]XP_010271546.1 PREDICTED: pentatricopeptide repeat-containing protein At3g26782, mitochondrial-like [Nelumbo nucifera]XP_010271547.1 PREDICTED: pentatricopeptide repeat-containing protein At3g26782, mitochondrial-like [Nelumbo nucifera]DAD40351.1 TPA_asm: hypothetical protein HUJ06_014674 [Nelumbo nucifera]